MYAFTYHRPTSIADAVKSVGEGKFLAGGHTLIPTMKQRLAMPGHLVDLNKVAELKGIADNGSATPRPSSAMTRMPTSRPRRRRRKAIPASPRWPAASAIRRCAIAARSAARSPTTIRSPIIPPRAWRSARPSSPTSAPSPPTTSSPACSRRRCIPARSLRRSPSRTPTSSSTRSSATRPRATRWSASSSPSAAGGVRVAVTGAGSDGVFRWTEAEARLAGNFSGSALDGLKVAASGLNGDIHAAAEYRAHLIGVMARRAVAAA